MNVIFYTSKLEKKYKIVIVIKNSNIDKNKILKYYINNNINPKDVLVVGLPYDKKRVSAKIANEFIQANLLPICNKVNAKVLLVADAIYFKFLTGETATSISMKYTLVKNTNIKAIPLPNYAGFFYNPDSRKHIILNLSVLKEALLGLPITTNNNYFIKNLYVDPKKIKKELNKLLNKKLVSVDIEAFSLEFTEAGIGTISFSENKKKSLCFYCDYLPINIYKKYYSQYKIINEYPDVKAVRIKNILVRKIIKNFFIKNKKTTYVYHNRHYDSKLLIYTLFMKEKLTNRKGLLKGLELTCGRSQDTQVITFLAMNSVSKIKLDLKSNTQEYMGNYGIDVKDITLVKPKELVLYNADDTIATQYLFDKYFNTVVNKYDLKDLLNILNSGAMAFIQMELEGMGLSIESVNVLNTKLKKERKHLLNKIKQSILVKLFTLHLKTDSYIVNIKKWKKKSESFTDHIKNTETFNPGSSKQLTELIHNYCSVPVFDTTNKGSPASDKEALKKIKTYLKKEISK